MGGATCMELDLELGLCPPGEVSYPGGPVTAHCGADKQLAPESPKAGGAQWRAGWQLAAQPCPGARQSGILDAETGKR